MESTGSPLTRRRRISVFLSSSLGFALFCAATAYGGETGFLLEKLPIGSEVTLPQPATTYVPLTARVTVAATDFPQTLRIMPVNISGGLVTDVRVAIFDAHSEQVRYVDIKPGLPFLYAFKKLSSISLLVDAAQAARLPGTLRMRIESDKPLSLKR